MARLNVHHLSWLRVGVPLIVVVALAFFVTSRFVKPAPPDSLTLSTGAAGGAYEHYARLYQAYLARNGVVLELRPSSGSVENLARLVEGTVDAAFVQGGVKPDVAENASASPSVVSLGALYVEPVWVFVRATKRPVQSVADLTGQRIAIGGEGSGTRPLALELLRVNGVDASNATLSPLAGPDAAAALGRGELDAAILIAGVSAPVIGDLLRRKDVRLVSLVHANALARQYPYMTPLSLPRGLVDIKADLPDRDITTVAVTANLLVRADLHPALMNLLLDAATGINGGASLLADAGTYPNPRRQDVPVADEAERFYKSGKPFLQRYLPFWVANLADRMLVYLIPIIAVLIPAVRFLPDLYAYRPKSKIAALYEKLRALEREIGVDLDETRVAGYVARLDEIEAEVTASNTPAWFAQDTYVLRAAIDLVRERLGHPGAKAIPGLRASARSDVP
jgi:TRAP transporter TAXI family solute receptor